MRIAILLVLALLSATVSNAQALGGSLRGVVEDSRGAQVASAAIAARLRSDRAT